VGSVLLRRRAEDRRNSGIVGRYMDPGSKDFLREECWQRDDGMVGELRGVMVAGLGSYWHHDN